jgi:hypothetical protein
MWTDAASNMKYIAAQCAIGEFLVLGSQVSPEHDIVRITVSSVWMILNAFHAIVAGWGFQLKGDVTGKLY